MISKKREGFANLKKLGKARRICGMCVSACVPVRVCVWELNVVTQCDLPNPFFNEIVSVAELVKACNGLGALM